ncbi:hypothetical protein PF003_g29305 [Phytophthora fragariae]|nr:hypothetical protein PF003_g29305 [Phytophthora fragariae]
MALSAQHMHLAVHATHQERQRDARLSPVTPRGHRRLRESSGDNVSRIRRLRFDRIREVLEASRVTRSCRLLVSTHKFNKRSQSLIRTVTRTRQIRELMRLAQTSKDASRSGVEVKEARRLWEPKLQAVRTVANVPHRKCLRAAGLHGEAVRDQAVLDCVRPREEPAGDNKKRIACSRAAGLHEEAIRDQAGLHCVCARVEPAGNHKKNLSTAGPGQNKKRGTGFRTRSERRKRAKLRKSRSGTEALLAVSAGQTQELETTVETPSVLTRTNTGLQYKKMKLENPPTLASELTSLPVTSCRIFARDLHDGRIEQICILSDVERMKCEAEELKQLVAEGVDALSAKSKKERFDEQSWDSLKSSPFYEVLREYRDVLPDDIPAELPQDNGVQHEIDLVPGTKYCVTRQWPLPREQVKAIDDFFESRRKAGQVRESKSPHSAPTVCVKKAQGGWRIVHAYNKLNDATVPAQTPIPREDVIIDSMALSTIFSALDLRDGFYQILMRERAIYLSRQ